MKRTIPVLFAAALIFSACKTKEDTAATKTAITKPVMSTLPSVYGFKVTDIDGNEFDFSSLHGKKIMIVNTASECGYTPQYQQLQELYDTYKSRNFTIIGFPCNDFGGQEPGTESDIKAFCSKNYGVTFPMMSKVKITGDNPDEIYKWLTKKELNGVADGEVRWNFFKFLINEKGEYVKMLTSKDDPVSDEVVKWIGN